MVRPGIAVYGLAPAAAMEHDPGVRALTPALSLKARVSYAKDVAAGEALSYGLRYRLPGDSVVATVPLGYADGVPRRLSEVGGEVLIGGRRRPLAGTVTMDQVLVDCGPGADVTARGRSGIYRPAGRRRNNGLGVGRPSRHHRLRGYVCAFSPPAPDIYLTPIRRGKSGGVVVTVIPGITANHSSLTRHAAVGPGRKVSRTLGAPLAAHERGLVRTFYTFYTLRRTPLAAAPSHDSPVPPTRSRHITTAR